MGPSHTPLLPPPPPPPPPRVVHPPAREQPQNVTKPVKVKHSKQPAASDAVDSEKVPQPPIKVPEGWRAKWSERRKQHFYFKMPQPGQTGKPKCYWLDQLRMVFA